MKKISAADVVQKQCTGHDKKRVCFPFWDAFENLWDAFEISKFQKKIGILNFLKVMTGASHALPLLSECAKPFFGLVPARQI